MVLGHEAHGSRFGDMMRHPSAAYIPSNSNDNDAKAASNTSRNIRHGYRTCTRAASKTKLNSSPAAARQFMHRLVPLSLAMLDLIIHIGKSSSFSTAH